MTGSFGLNMVLCYLRRLEELGEARPLESGDGVERWRLAEAREIQPQESIE